MIYNNFKRFNTEENRLKEFEAEPHPVSNKFRNLIGTKFNRLEVIMYGGKSNGVFIWHCQCDCGNIAMNVQEGALKRTNSRGTKSCGCFRVPRTTHNMRHSRIYGIWSGMIQRCTNEKMESYERYGGRGIKIEDSRWYKFENFYDDMGECPEGLSLDRIDNDKGYSKENCRWATIEEQANNKSTNRKITFNGKTLSLSQWARELNINRDIIKCRILRLGWSVEDALTIPKQRSGTQYKKIKNQLNS